MAKKILNNLGNRCRQLLKMVDFLYCVNEHWSANDHPETESVRHMRGVIHEWRRELEEKAGTARIAWSEQSHELKSDSEGAHAAKPAKRVVRSAWILRWFWLNILCINKLPALKLNTWERGRERESTVQLISNSTLLLIDDSLLIAWNCANFRRRIHVKIAWL